VLIRNTATAPRERVEGNVAQFDPAPRFTTDMLPALWDAALRYGIDPVVIVAQAGHETGWGRYTGLVPPEFHNPCGLKLRDLTAFPNSEVTAAHAVFPDWATGARAHAQHLMAYCQTAVADPIVDPRWVWVFGRKAAVTEVEQLGGMWAPNLAYGTLVAAAATKLKAEPMVAYMPGIEWVGGPRSDNGDYMTGVPWRICLHTTETPPISRGGNPRSMAASATATPHVWYDWEADQGWQSVTLDSYATALWSDGDPQTNRARCLQVEIVGYSEEAGDWPDVALERIARRIVVPFVKWVQQQGGTVDLSDAGVPLPGAIPGSASEYAPQRMSSERWLNGPVGLVGHRHVPRNDHWDPGDLNTRIIARYARNLLGGTNQQGFLMALTDAQQLDLYNKVNTIFWQCGNEFPSAAAASRTVGAQANQAVQILQRLQPLLDETHAYSQASFWQGGNEWPSEDAAPRTVGGVAKDIAARLEKMAPVVDETRDAAGQAIGAVEQVGDAVHDVGDAVSKINLAGVDTAALAEEIASRVAFDPDAIADLFAARLAVSVSVAPADRIQIVAPMSALSTTSTVTIPRPPPPAEDPPAPEASPGEEGHQ